MRKLSTLREQRFRGSYENAIGLLSRVRNHDVTQEGFAYIASRHYLSFVGGYYFV